MISPQGENSGWPFCESGERFFLPIPNGNFHLILALNAGNGSLAGLSPTELIQTCC